MKSYILLQPISLTDTWYRKERPSQNVRYVPIEVESGHPSTSTPIDASERLGRVRNVPIKLVKENGPSTPARKPRMHTPVRPVIHAVIDDEDDDDDPEVSFTIYYFKTLANITDLVLILANLITF